MPENQNVNTQSSSAPIVDPIAATPQAPSAVGNTSGQGSGAIVPDEIKGWNWGAFLLTWIWSIGNNVWIGLVSLVPYVGFVMSIILGIKGSEWAWQARRWDSIEQFKKVQRKWTIAGLVIPIVIVIILIIIIIVIFAINPAAKVEQRQTYGP